MPYRNLQHFISTLEKSGELIRIREYVNPALEIAEVTDRISKSVERNKALLFENTGTSFPLLINMFGSNKRMCLALGVKDLDDIAKDMETLFKSFMQPRESVFDKLKLLPDLSRLSSYMPKIRQGRGECQEVIMTEPDVTMLPVMKCWPEDGGPFITLPVIHTIDPLTGIRNVGLYRMQVFGPRLAALHWHRHKVSAGHFNSYKKLGNKMPVAVALGGDPVYAYCASAPMPPNVDEYILAGFIRKKSVQLVKCITQDIHVPADADIIIEGYVNPAEDFILEGPFGDHTGYYSLADYYPRFHITCITHRQNAVYPSTIVGIPPQEDAWIGKASERIFVAPIKMTIVPEILDMDMPAEGVFHNLNIVKIKKEYPGQAQKVMNALWGAGQMMLNKVLIIVDEKVNIHDYADVAKAVSENMEPAADIFFSRGPMDVLDHSCSKFAFGGKMCIDATGKLPEESNKENRNLELEIGNAQIQLPEIKGMNTELAEKGISAVIVSIVKNRNNQIRELGEKICAMEEFRQIKFIIFTDSEIDVKNIPDVLWYATNNIDPVRDCHIFTSKNEDSVSHLVIDGTRKTKKFDNFHRQWPNVICSSLKTTETVDAKWYKLGLGELISSPSLKYGKLQYGGGAVAEEK